MMDRNVPLACTRAGLPIKMVGGYQHLWIHTHTHLWIQKNDIIILEGNTALHSASLPVQRGAWEMIGKAMDRLEDVLIPKAY